MRKTILRILTLIWVPLLVADPAAAYAHKSSELELTALALPLTFARNVQGLGEFIVRSLLGHGDFAWADDVYYPERAEPGRAEAFWSILFAKKVKSQAKPSESITYEIKPKYVRPATDVDLRSIFQEPVNHEQILSLLETPEFEDLIRTRSRRFKGVILNLPPSETTVILFNPKRDKIAPFLELIRAHLKGVLFSAAWLIRGNEYALGIGPFIGAEFDVSHIFPLVAKKPMNSQRKLKTSA